MKACSKCNTELFSKYYSDVPGYGDLCLDCWLVSAPIAASDTSVMQGTLEIDDTVDDTVDDPVNPSHYDDDECMKAIEKAGYGKGFARGCIISYIWRAGRKGGPEKELEDIEKLRWYVDREIARLKGSIE